jgi:hypothetical protein
MTTRRLGWSRTAGAWAIVLAALLTEGSASAQYAVSIPFNPWSSPYEAYVYPVVPNNMAIPNQARFSVDAGFEPSNRFQNFYTFDSGVDVPWLNPPAGGPELRARGLPATGGRYIPYNSVYRLYDQDYKRVYQPNAGQADDLYLQAISEPDPAKRAQLVEAWKNARRAADREAGLAERRVTRGGTLTGEERRESSVLAPATSRRTGASGSLRAAASERPARTGEPTPDEVLSRGGGSGPVQSSRPGANRPVNLGPIYGEPSAGRRGRIDPDGGRGR